MERINDAGVIELKDVNGQDGIEDNQFIFTASDLVNSETFKDVDTPISELVILQGSLYSPAGGSLSKMEINTYTPPANVNGEIEFSFIITDNQGGYNFDESKINLTPINDLPLLTSPSDQQALTVKEDNELLITATTLLEGFSDADTDVFSVIEDTVTSAQGTVEIQGTDFIFKPNADFNGFAEITFDITDNPADPANAVSGRRVAEVTAVNDKPIAADNFLFDFEGSILRINPGNIGFSDIDNDNFDSLLQLRALLLGRIQILIFMDIKFLMAMLKPAILR